MWNFLSTVRVLKVKFLEGGFIDADDKKKKFRGEKSA